MVLTSSRGSGNPYLVFEEAGWKPAVGKEGSITVTVTSEDGEQPELMRITVKVMNATKLDIQILNSNDELVLTVSSPLH